MAALGACDDGVSVLVDRGEQETHFGVLSNIELKPLLKTGTLEGLYPQ